MEVFLESHEGVSVNIAAVALFFAFDRITSILWKFMKIIKKDDTVTWKEFRTKSKVVNLVFNKRDDFLSLAFIVLFVLQIVLLLTFAE